MNPFESFANETSAEAEAAESGGRRARKARATRRALLDAGLNAFHRQPIALVSVLDITEAADVAKGVFYLHFASKDAFLLALWQDVQEAFLDAVRGAVATADPEERRARLEAAIGVYARTAADHPQRACFLLRMSSFMGDELGTPGQLAERRAAYIKALAEALSVDDAGARALRALDACCWGLIWQSMQLGESPPSAKELERFVPWRAWLGISD